MRPQLLENRFGFVIYCRVESEFSGEPAAFLVGSRDTDDSAAIEFSNLPNQRPDRTCSTRDNERFAPLGLPISSRPK